MNSAKKQIEGLKNLIVLLQRAELSKYAKNEEVVPLIKSIIEAVETLKSTLLARVDGKGEEWQGERDKALGELGKATERLRGIEGKMDSMHKEMMATHDSSHKKMKAEMDAIRHDMPAPMNMAYLEDAVTALQEALRNIHVEPTDIRDSLATLEGDNRLDKSAIKGWDQLFAEVREIASKRVQTPAKAFMIYTVDLTSQVDGATTSFSVGGTHFGIVGVFSTQAPIHFRPIIDYTETRTGFDLVGITLQSGQTLIAQFLK